MVVKVAAIREKVAQEQRMSRSKEEGCRAGILLCTDVRYRLNLKNVHKNRAM